MKTRCDTVYEGEEADRGIEVGAGMANRAREGKARGSGLWGGGKVGVTC